MPAAKIHEEQAKHNLKFFESITDTNFRDWKLTVAFYTILQLIDSELTKENPRWRDGSFGFSMYSWREKCLAINFKKIYPHYNVLFQRSKEARYLEAIGEKIAISYLTQAIVDDCIENHFKPILSHFKFSLS